MPFPSLHLPPHSFNFPIILAWGSEDQHKLKQDGETVGDSSIGVQGIGYKGMEEYKIFLKDKMSLS